jgi:dTDP-4-amino-4,6-dideoxygalactose transaminase
MFVPFLDLKRESERDRLEMEQAITRVLQSGWYILGPELEALETEFAAYLKVPYAAGVACGTDALTLALQATGIIRSNAGDEVITTALTAAYTGLAVCRAGAIPRFVDIQAETLQIDPDQVERWIGPRTRAILPVHLYGNACDLQKMGDLARAHDLPVIEDACQAHGSLLKGAALGSFGVAAGFSFYPTKNLGALGDAGMVVTRSKDLDQQVRKLRYGGQSQTYVHELLGFNSRLDEIQAAVLRLRLKKLESRNEARRKLASRYDEALADLDVRVLHPTAEVLPNRHLYPVRTARREELRRHLQNEGIGTLVHYPVPLPRQPALQQFVLAGQEFPAAEEAATEIFSLPLYPELTAEEQQYVIRAMRRFFKA